MAYDFEDLGGFGFQDLAASLAVAVFGPNIQVMGTGWDGGRDMYTTEEPMTWANGLDPHSGEENPTAKSAPEAWTLVRAARRIGDRVDPIGGGCGGHREPA